VTPRFARWGITWAGDTVLEVRPWYADPNGLQWLPSAARVLAPSIACARNFVPRGLAYVGREAVGPREVAVEWWAPKAYAVTLRDLMLA
jgi:hypothetical protein